MCTVSKFDRSKWLRISVPLLVFLIGFWYVVSLFLSSQQFNGTVRTDTPVWNPDVPPTVHPPQPPTSPTEGCQPQKPITPVKFTIERMNVDSTVLSLGWDPATGAALAPPDKEAFAVGWLKEGPQPGSDKGNVVLTTHTYHVGQALGNELYSPETGLKPGDLIKMSDASGYTVCYSQRETVKVRVSDYNKRPSNVLYDNNGRPQIALIVCWDWDWQAKASESRVIFYADPVQI